MNISKRYIVDEKGNPKEVIIPMEDFRRIEELLGLDLDDEAVQHLREPSVATAVCTPCSASATTSM